MATTIQQIELPKKARAVDTSGNNNHGQIYSGRGLEFDGIGDNLRLDGFTLEGTKATVAFWINTATTTGYVIDLNSTIRFVVGLSSNKFKFYDGNGWKQFGTIATDVYLRCVVVLDGTVAKGFVNGHQLGTDQTIQNISIASNTTAAIGSDNSSGSTFITAKLSDFQIWDAAFTQADVTYDYLNPESLALNNSGTALTESNLKLWYPMQDGHRGQQSYILDGANSGLGDELVSEGDFSGADDGDPWTTGAGWSIADNKATSAGGNEDAYLTQSNMVLGRTYKVTFDVNDYTSGTLSIREFGQSPVLSVTSTGSYVAYLTPVSSTALGFRSAGGAGGYVGSVSNVSVKAINDKHHATTVFYGDELVASWTNVDFDSFTSSGSNITQMVSGASTDNCNTSVTIVGGRTYKLEFTSSQALSNCQVRISPNTSLTSAQLPLSTLASGSNEVSFVADGDYSYIGFYASGAFSDTQISSFSLKEVGVASGWTDADQQLHIPQTALQSYNELAWFDGTSASNGYVDLDTEIATTDNDWSLSFWIFQEDNGQAYSFPFGGTSIKNIALKNNNTSKLYYKSNAGSTYHALSNDTIPYGEWVSIVITATADTSITAYVNGVAQTTNSDMSDTEIVVDQFMNGYSNTLYNILGTINEISYYSEVLTATEVLDLFNDGKAKSALEASGSAGLVGYWRNNGLSEWKDLKGSNDGNTSAGVTETILIPQGVDSTRDAQGFIMNKQKDTSCLNLDGIGYVSLPTTGVVTDDFSFEAWAKAESWTSGESVIMEVGASMLLFGNNHGYIRAVDGTFTNQLPSHSFVVGNWYHIVVTRIRNGNQIMYVDGVAKNTVTAPDTAMTLSDTTIGKDNTTRVSRDALDGVKIYSKALSDTEVLRNYNATKGSHRN